MTLSDPLTSLEVRFVRMKGNAAIVIAPTCPSDEIGDAGLSLRCKPQRAGSRRSAQASEGRNASVRLSRTCELRGALCHPRPQGCTDDKRRSGCKANVPELVRVGGRHGDREQDGGKRRAKHERDSRCYDTGDQQTRRHTRKEQAYGEGYHSGGENRWEDRPSEVPAF